MTLIPVMLCVNVLVTFAVAFGLFRDGARMAVAYGHDSAARRILACLYLAIGIVSLYALLQLGLGQPQITRAVAFTLFPIQIVYKLLTIPAVGLSNPVVIANLVIAAFLGVALVFG